MSKVRFVSCGDYENRIIRSESEFPLWPTAIDREPPHSRLHRIEFKVPRTRHFSGQLINPAITPNLSVCSFMIPSHAITESTERENSRWVDRINFCSLWGIRWRQGVLWRSLWRTRLLFRLSGMRANQITQKPFSPNPHHIISQHKPCWISGYWTSNQLSLAPL